MLTQALQVPALTNTYVTYKIGLGAILFVGLSVTHTAALTLRFTSEIEWQLGLYYLFYFSTEPDEVPAILYAVNLVPVALLVALWRNRALRNAS
jgi:hypothetical protein